MNLKKIILTLGLGTLAAHALPHGNPNSLDAREEWPENSTLQPVHPSLQPRTQPNAAPITKAIGSDECDKREGLYVPFLYAAWMDADDGKYERYQCDAAEKGDKCHVQKGGNIPKRIVTDGLASCVSINVISKKGTIMTHIPPYVCQMINGDKVPDKDGKYKQQADNIKKAIKELKHDHLKKMGETTVVAITGPYINNDAMNHQTRVTKVVKELFGMGVNKWEHLDEPMPHFDGERSTTVDMTASPPKFYKENSEVTIHVP